MQRKKNTNQLFFIFCVSIAAWLTCQFFADRADANSGLWIKISFIFFEIMTPAFFAFVYSYPNNRPLPTRIKVLSILPLLVFGPFTFSSLLTKKVEIINDSVVFAPGPLYIFQTVICSLFVLFGIGLLLARLGRATSKGRNQMLLLVAAVLVPLIGSTISGVLFVNEASAQLARPLSFFVMALFISYAIVFHKLFDVKFFVVRALGYLITVALLALLYLVPIILLFNVFLNDLPQSSLIAINCVFIILAATLFQPIKRYFDRATSRLFYQDAYDPQQLLAELNRNVLNNVDVEPLLNRSAAVITRYLKVLYCSFELQPTSYNSHRLLGDKHELGEKDLARIYELLSEQRARIVVADDVQESSPELFKLLNRYEVGVVSDLRSDKDNVGLMFLGVKKSGNAINKQDREIIGIIASELTVATQNALRFEEIENFSVTLQQKVDDATKRLKRANDKLKLMDETKDEFISMASHQLRTPLTSVKGYVSMVLEGDAGPINDMQKKLLEQSFISSQRMVFLIADLLNLSRLKTGKFIIEAVPTNLADVIEGEVEQLKETAGGKDIKLVYAQPKEFPTLMLDETKIRQVIMNFVDNAIYYTPAGGKIDISLVETEKSVEFRVKDNGIGVPESEQHNLFTKFFRAKNAQKARPDGTGLGLFMAKKVIVAQGGALIFESKVGKGSTFGFSFAKEKLKVDDIPHPPEK